MSLSAFAEKHDLTMEVSERINPSVDWMKYYAHFEKSDTKEGCILRGEYGNGCDEESALTTYAKAISGKLLVIDGFGPSRREIQVSQLHHP